MPSREGNCPANLKTINLELETILPPLPRSGSVQQITAANRRWAPQFRCRGQPLSPAVAEF
jgi:hypothetical protein